MKTILLGLFLLTSCFNTDGPEDILRKVSYGISKGEISQDQLVNFTTGKLSKDFEELSEEDYQVFLSANKRDSFELRVTKELCEGDKCSFTYIAKFGNSYGADKYKSEVKKIAELIQDEEGWKIKSFSNVKTYIEGLTPMTINSK